MSVEATRPILVGESPSRSGDRYHHFPLSGLVGQRLCEMAGIEPQPEGSRYGRYYWALRERFDCVNVFDRHADATPWSAASARDNWAAILGEDYSECSTLVVVALGRRVSAAVGLSLRRWGAWSGTSFDDGHSVWHTAVPHPSGLNRMYNGAEVRERAGVVLREAMEIARVGCSPDSDSSSEDLCRRLRLGDVVAVGHATFRPG